MKKTICILSLTLLLLSVGTACTNRTEFEPTPVEYTGETQTTTEAQYTLGQEESSTKLDISKNEYEISYFDKDGNGVKIEHYLNKKLIYYYVNSAADEIGNGVQQKYYDAYGKLLATEDSGCFYDADGKQITEETMDYILYQAKK